MNAQQLHQIALSAVNDYKKSEASIIDILQKIDQAKSYREFGCASLFEYATKLLKLSESVAYIFINVARKAAQVPALKAAIEAKELSVSAAKKIASVLTTENSQKWIEMASTLPQQKLEKEVAKINPKAACADRATYLTENRMQLTMGVSEKLLEEFKRVQDIECQSHQKAVDYEGTLKALVEFYLTHKDPLSKNSVQKTRNKQVLRPVPLKQVTPALKRKVLQRDGGQCTGKNSDGTRCPHKRWLDVHHLREQSQGGAHIAENLTTLCSAHHRLVHAHPTQGLYSGYD